MESTARGWSSGCRNSRNPLLQPTFVDVGTSESSKTPSRPLFSPTCFLQTPYKIVHALLISRPSAIEYSLSADTSVKLADLDGQIKEAVDGRRDRRAAGRAGQPEGGQDGRRGEGAAGGADERNGRREDAHKRKDFVRSLAAYDAALGIATEAEAAGIEAARARRWRKYSQVIFSKYPNICITERPLSDLVLVRVVVVHRLHPSQRHVLLVELRFTPGSTAGNYIRRQRLGS